VPTLGGNHSFIVDAAAEILKPGPFDQQALESRPDVLIFETDPLLRDTEVSGPITMKLFAASSATDTDFVVRLIDKAPDSTRYNLTEGIMRTRFHKSVWESPELIEPGEVIEYSIELQPTSNLFKKGHQIVLHITSSSFPLWDPNTNTGNDQGTETESIIATQSIYLDKRYPSHIKLNQAER
jgi:putative CocE/NonD family hydrolase